ncbi:hypothetical protein Agub_g6955 [Astrephomene gubernaculifera]|uniref:NAD(+) kinase n=1 Tax=Astrephomene gubernaculifera TaxID=47775 RepID=A0AAD3HM18_9CHLO|nr:hypothetical protein Agub_g6955 [Astrephomene gubernaculifera]
MLLACLRMAVLSAAHSGARRSFAAAAATEHVARRHFHARLAGFALSPQPVSLAPRMTSNASPTRRRSLTTSCVGEPEGFESGIIRGASVKYNDSAALQLRRRALLQWQSGSPSRVLIIKKPRNPAASAKMREMGQWLAARGVQVFVERVVWATEFKEFNVFDPRVNRHDIDFCITLGGDGTVLYMTSLFEEDEPLPPTLCFAMGSLGFLTPFDAATFAPTLERVLDTSRTPLHCTLRTRKRCEVVYDGRLEAVHHVLNECVLDRGSFPGAVLLEIFVDGSYVSNVEADGLIISTPSGSTAYSMSAGGPVVAPSVPCTVLTPIAPLSLSFRPVVLPESSSLCVHLPTCARSHARASFDGKRPMRVRRGTSLFFTASLCPLPVISLGRMDTDWYEGITSKLKWNQAIRQLPSCPSPVGARQQELCSARHADRGGAGGGADDAEGCSVSDAVHWDATAALAAARARSRGGDAGNGNSNSNGGGNGNGNGNGGGRPYGTATAAEGATAGTSAAAALTGLAGVTVGEEVRVDLGGGGSSNSYRSSSSYRSGSGSTNLGSSGGSVTDSLDEQRVEEEHEEEGLHASTHAHSARPHPETAAAAAAAAAAAGTPRRTSEEPVGIGSAAHWVPGVGGEGGRDEVGAAGEEVQDGGRERGVAKG